MRKPCVAKTKNAYYIVTPDNGALTFIKKYYGIEEVREIDASKHYFKSVELIDVFHGRDLFSYCGAKLASGQIAFEEVGPKYPVSEIVEYKLPKYTITKDTVTAKAFGTSGNNDNGFGILMTNIPSKEFCNAGFQFGDKVHIEISNKQEVIMDDDVMFNKSFGYVNVGNPILHPEINTFLGLALNMDNFCKKYKIQNGINYNITIKHAKKNRE